MKKVVKILLLAMLVMGCSDEREEWLLIRLSNISSYNFENINVNTSYTGNTFFGNLDSGKSTVYKQFDIAYRYAFIELEIVGEIYGFQPDDYVGETPLTRGKYTYQIDLTDIQKETMELSLQLIRD